MKKLEDDNLFDSMRERLGRYEEVPSEELWGKIAASTSTKKKERIWPIFLEPVGVVIIGVALLLSYQDVKIEDVKIDDVRIEDVRNEDVKIEESKTASVDTNDSESIVISVKPKSTIVNSKSSNIFSDQTQSQSIIPAPETKVDSVDAFTPQLLSKDSSVVMEVIPPYKKPKSKFQFYISVTPSLAFNKMIPDGNDNLIVQGFAPVSPLSVKRFGFGVDLGFQRDVNHIFGYYGGLSFYHQQQQITYNYYEKEGTVERVGDDFVFVINREQRTKTFDYTMNNLGARAGVLVTLKGDKLKHKFGAGLIYTRSLNSSNSYLAYQLSYRNEVKVNDNISWFVEPTFIYSFLSKEKLDEPFKLKPYRAGISVGMLYRF